MSGAEREALRVVAMFDRLGGIELEGDIQDLTELSKRLISDSKRTAITLLVPTDASAAPYDGFLSSLVVKETSEKARITCVADVLVVAGSRYAIRSISETIASVAERAKQMSSPESLHVHLEFYEEHPFLASDSEPLTITAMNNRSFEVQLRLLPTTNGGRSAPLASGYRSLIRFDGVKLDFGFELELDSKVNPGGLAPGTSGQGRVTIWGVEELPELLSGQLFEIREGERVVGKGTIVGDPRNA